MANYVRFEVYLPVHYSRSFENPDIPGDRTLIRYSLDSRLVASFAEQAVKRFGGASQAHPAEGPPIRGWWWSDTNHQLIPDDVTYFFVLVAIERLDEAQTFFNSWRKKFMRELNQEVILITFYSVQTIGGFL